MKRSLLLIVLLTFFPLFTSYTLKNAFIAICNSKFVSLKSRVDCYNFAPQNYLTWAGDPTDYTVSAFYIWNGTNSIQYQCGTSTYMNHTTSNGFNLCVFYPVIPYNQSPTFCCSYDINGAINNLGCLDGDTNITFPGCGKFI
jgi:hypothetical protein